MRKTLTLILILALPLAAAPAPALAQVRVRAFSEAPAQAPVPVLGAGSFPLDSGGSSLATGFLIDAPPATSLPGPAPAAAEAPNRAVINPAAASAAPTLLALPAPAIAPPAQPAEQDHPSSPSQGSEAGRTRGYSYVEETAPQVVPGDDAPITLRLARTLQNRPLKEIGGSSESGKDRALGELFDGLPRTLSQELEALGPRLLGRPLPAEEVRSAVEETALRQVRWYQYLNPFSSRNGIHGETHPDGKIDLWIHPGWRKYPSIENHFRTLYAHEYVHRLQVQGRWNTAFDKEVGPVAVEVLRAVELAGIEALRAGAVAFIGEGTLAAFDTGRAWALSERKASENSFYWRGFLAGAAYAVVESGGSWEEAWSYLRRVFTAPEQKTPKPARAPPLVQWLVRGAAVVATAVAGTHGAASAAEPGSSAQAGTAPASPPPAAHSLLDPLGSAGYIVGNAAGFLYPIFQVRKAFLDGDSRSTPFWETLLGMTASLALAFNATAMGRWFWGVQNIFGALGMIAPVFIGWWLAGRKKTPAGSWLWTAAASAALIALAAGLYLAAAAVLPGLLGAVFAGSTGLRLGIQLGAAGLFFLMFAPPIISVIRGRVPKGFTRFFSLFFSIGGFGMAVWALDKALGAADSASLAQFLVYGVSQLTLAVVSFISYLLIRRQEGRAGAGAPQSGKIAGTGEENHG